MITLKISALSKNKKIIYGIIILVIIIGLITFGVVFSLFKKNHHVSENYLIADGKKYRVDKKTDLEKISKDTNHDTIFYFYSDGEWVSVDSEKTTEFIWSSNGLFDDGVITKIPDNFLAQYAIPDELSGNWSITKMNNFPSTIQYIGNYVLYGAINFNSPIVFPSNLIDIGDGFLGGCSSFNNQIIFNNSLKHIGKSFLNSATSFNQPISIANTSIAGIGDDFLISSVKFNQKIELNNELQNIGRGFLSNCFDFNQPIDLGSQIISIGNGFLGRMLNYANIIDTHNLSADIFEADDDRRSSFTCVNVTGITYIDGFKIIGAYAEDIKEKFPESSTDNRNWHHNF